MDADHGSVPEQDEAVHDVADDHEAVLSLATATNSEPVAISYDNHPTPSTAPISSMSIYPDPPSNTAAGRRSRAITEAVRSSQATQQSAAEETQYFRSLSLALPQARVLTTTSNQHTSIPAKSLHRLHSNMMMQQQPHVMPQRSPAITAGQRAAMSSAPYQRTPPPRNNNAGHAYPVPPDTSANGMYANSLPNSRPSAGMSLMEQRAASHLIDFQNSQQSPGQSWLESLLPGQNQYNPNKQQGSPDERIAYEPYLFQKPSGWMQGTSPPTNKSRPAQRRR